jgi:hypothetical protein
MNVSKWGPGGWVFLHSITFNYPLEPTNENKIIYRNFFKSLSDILPCKYCRESYKIYFKYLPIDSFLDSRIGVCYWLYRIHNLINDKIFAKNTSLESTIRKYEDIRAKCGKMSKNGSLDKVYKTCKIESNKINLNYLSNFMNESEKYKIIFDNLLDKMYKSEENPNKECLKNNINRVKIIYSVII